MQFLSILSHYNPILLLVLLFRHVMETESTECFPSKCLACFSILTVSGKQIELFSLPAFSSGWNQLNILVGRILPVWFFYSAALFGVEFDIFPDNWKCAVDMAVRLQE